VVDGGLGEPPILHVYVPAVEELDPRANRPVSGLLRLVSVAALTDGSTDTCRRAARRTSSR
jgi:hypothetical protein